MEFKMVKVFLVVLLLQVAHSLKGIHGHNVIKRQAKRYSSSHPAFSMFRNGPPSFPSLGMHSMHGSSSGSGYIECITDDIVCPSWCLMEDDWGCKTCPCGPANGMAPRIVSEGREQHHSEEKHDCIGTILCMLSCKDNYKLGQRGSNGCQTCSCERKDNTRKNDTRKNDTKSANSTGPTQGCTFPLCVNGQNPNTGPSSNSGMTSLPIGGKGSLTSDKDILVSGLDCLGPSCSAKNGMRLMEQLTSGQSTQHPSSKPATITPTTPATTTKQPRSCPITDACILYCKFTIKLGEPGADGCKSCTCSTAPAKPPQTILLSPPTRPPTTPRQCPEVQRCMATCRYGYRIHSSQNVDQCPECKCVIPLSPPPPTTTRIPSIISLLRVCPDAVHCMKTCTTGYKLTASNLKGCPQCTCNQEPTVILICERPLSCPNRCTIGYKCDDIGCPSCTCVTPSETLLTVNVHTPVTEAALTCAPKFSCVDRCTFGYQTGHDGCPTCVCLEPVLLNAHNEGQVQLVPVTHAPATSTPNVFGVGCLGPSCSAMNGLGQSNMFTNTLQGEHIGLNNAVNSGQNGHFHSNNGETGGTSGTQFGQSVNKHTINTDNSGELTNQLTVNTDNNGETTNQHVSSVVQSGTFYVGQHSTGAEVVNVFHKPSAHAPNHVNMATDGGTDDRIHSAMEACPETVTCITSCSGSYNLTTISGVSCPKCTCHHEGQACMGPSCVVPVSHIPDILPAATLSPGQCVAILHCVMTCQSGYDIGEYGQNGCPTCTCL